MAWEDEGSLTAMAWEDEGCTPAFSLRCFCSQNVLSPEKPQEVLEEKILQVWRVREEVPWEVTTSCLAENLLREVCALPFLRPTGIALASSLIELTCPMLSAWERRSTMARSGPASPPWTTWTAEGEADPAGSHISERALSQAVALCCLGGTLLPPPCRSPSVSSDPCTAPCPPPVAGCAGESPAVTEGEVYATLPLHRCLSSGLLAPRRSLATSQLFPFPVLIPRLRNATLKCFL
nr:uncharacterized protein LOC123841764 [Mirounga angustirostris]